MSAGVTDVVAVLTGGPSGGVVRRMLTALAAIVAIAAFGAAPAGAAGWVSWNGPYGPVYEGVRYGSASMEHMTVYASQTPGSPVVMLVHGGGWRSRDSLGTFEPEALDLQRSGFTVFNVQYPVDSLSTPAFPLEPEAIEAATQWARGHAALFDADATKTVLVGGSAGAHLVLVAMEQLNAAAPGTVRSVVALSAPTDFPKLTAGIQDGEITHESFIASVREALGEEMSGASRTFASIAGAQQFETAWSPALNVSHATCAPTLLFNSSAELIPLSEAQEMSSQLQSASCPTTLQVVPGTRHAFAYWESVSPQVIAFIKATA